MRTALVTGGASGIGRAIAEGLAADGLAVIIADLRGAEEAAAEIGGDARGVETDVSSTDSVNAAVATAPEGIDVLVNCAGWDDLMPFLKTDEDFWDKVIEINYKGILRTCHAAVPGMVERGWGRVINIGSDAGRVGSSMEAVYAGAKGGVIAFTKTLAREVARKGVTANTVCPGPTDTPMLQGIVAASDDGDKVIRAMTSGVAMKRLGQPEEIAAAVRFFAGEDAGFITGQTLSVSGGLTMV
ncbi:MAG: 2-hydroxycyclohexanecarboxyl-CoA dehydrogenase [Solirubrobacteraceae bacterium]|jgi:2-hydroxycyclohexanecarboxyl-CoA dehydrogenase|nr:2-hydroxycyclohexanecarboxyl-CoA dehydrogenase [Solirubrobacteraceae bacterium]